MNKDPSIAHTLGGATEFPEGEFGQELLAVVVHIICLWGTLKKYLYKSNLIQFE
jgi:hypothetical protein